IEKGHLVEEHGQIGGETGHGPLLKCVTDKAESRGGATWRRRRQVGRGTTTSVDHLSVVRMKRPRNQARADPIHL
ncbi:hypothetical protein MKI84_17940, partial [Ancylobacter sp. A5.8]|uniref:hypothetical protein n=1 Tax=Ancylobacter gelatini TaxID=2919920 RepID=UPI001F4ED410